MNYANLIYTFPKIIGVSFRKLWLFYSEDCGSFVPESVVFSCLYCRLLRFSKTQEAYLPRTRDIRDTYGTIAPRNLPFFAPQKFPIIKISAVVPLTKL